MNISSLQSDKGDTVEHPATRNALDEIFSTIIDGGAYDDINHYFTDDFTDHSAAGDLHGTKAFSGMLEGFRSAMPGFRHDLSDLTLIGDDMAVWQVHLTATFSGEFMNVRGHGQPIELYVANAARFAPDGRVREHWGMAQDSFGQLLEQMGIDVAAMAAQR
jgi:predicted ester cyclase